MSWIQVSLFSAPALVRRAQLNNHQRPYVMYNGAYIIIHRHQTEYTLNILNPLYLHIHSSIVHYKINISTVLASIMVLKMYNYKQGM